MKSCQKNAVFDAVAAPCIYGGALQSRRDVKWVAIMTHTPTANAACLVSNTASRSLSSFTQSPRSRTLSPRHAGTSCAQHQTNSIGSIQMRAGSHSHTQLTADNLQASIMPEAVLRGKSFALNSAVATRAMQGTWWPLIMKTAMAPRRSSTWWNTRSQHENMRTLMTVMLQTSQLDKPCSSTKRSFEVWPSPLDSYPFLRKFLHLQML